MSTRRCLPYLVLTLAPFLCGGALDAQGRTPRTGVGLDASDGIVTMTRQYAGAGQSFAYRSYAGTLPIRENATGEVLGEVFFVSYHRPSSEKRPLVFLWNGGPGSSTSLVHLLGFGPIRLGPNGEQIPNAGSWLSEADLVFVDPIGTGYSRMSRPQLASLFYTPDGDAASIAEFIRVYLTRTNLWDHPLYLAGESYGVVRAAGVAVELHRRAIPVVGAILIGLDIPLGKLTGAERDALLVPTYTAAAAFHNRLATPLTNDSASVQKAKQWARSHYATALGERGALTTPERAVVADSLRRYTGLSTLSHSGGDSLALNYYTFARTLLRDRGQVIGHYDTRLTASLDSTVQGYDPTRDPSLKSMISGRGVLAYLRETIGYRVDLPYQGPFGGGFPPPHNARGDWMSILWTQAARSLDSTRTRWFPERMTEFAQTSLEQALKEIPGFRVLSVCGWYDLICAAAANERVWETLSAEWKSRVTVRNYPGGHAVYTDAATRLALQRDAFAFFSKSYPPTS